MNTLDDHALTATVRHLESRSDPHRGAPFLVIDRDFTDTAHLDGSARGNHLADHPDDLDLDPYALRDPALIATVAALRAQEHELAPAPDAALDSAPAPRAQPYRADIDELREATAVNHLLRDIADPSLRASIEAHERAALLILETEADIASDDYPASFPPLAFPLDHDDDHPFSLPGDLSGSLTTLDPDTIYGNPASSASHPAHAPLAPIAPQLPPNPLQRLPAHPSRPYERLREHFAQHA